MRSYSFIIFMFFCTACNIEQAEVKQGPKGSWWLGGDDGGVFILIEDDNNTNDNIYFGTIYNDYDQTVWYKGSFKLVGDIQFAADNRELYEFWDGQRVYLKQSSYLEATDPIPPL